MNLVSSEVLALLLYAYFACRRLIEDRSHAVKYQEAVGYQRVARTRVERYLRQVLESRDPGWTVGFLVNGHLAGPGASSVDEEGIGSEVDDTEESEGTTEENTGTALSSTGTASSTVSQGPLVEIQLFTGMGQLSPVYHLGLWMGRRYVMLLEVCPSLDVNELQVTSSVESLSVGSDAISGSGFYGSWMRSAIPVTGDSAGIIDDYHPVESAHHIHVMVNRSQQLPGDPIYHDGDFNEPDENTIGSDGNPSGSDAAASSVTPFFADLFYRGGNSEGDAWLQIMVSPAGQSDSYLLISIRKVSNA